MGSYVMMPHFLVRAGSRRRGVGPARAVCCTLLLVTGLAGCWTSARVGGLEVLSGVPDGGPLEIADHRQAASLRFLVLGDSGTGTRDQWRVAEGMADACAEPRGCDFALLVGDAIYPSGVGPTAMTADGPRPDRKFADRFERPYHALGRLDMWIVPGNHDWKSVGSVATQVSYSAFSPRWRMPAPYYAVPRLPEWIRIYGLDTTPIFTGQDDQQVEAARRSLCGAEGWRLLFGHHPVFTSGRYADSSGAIEEMRKQLVDPLIAACGVQIYFSGHEHFQEHLRAPTFDQVIQGAAAELRSPQHVRRRGHGVGPVAPAMERLGFAVVDVDPERLELRFVGCDRSDGCRVIHCAAYTRGGFDDPATRSTPCDPGSPSAYGQTGSRGRSLPELSSPSGPSAPPATPATR